MCNATLLPPYFLRSKQFVPLGLLKQVEPNNVALGAGFFKCLLLLMNIEQGRKTTKQNNSAGIKIKNN